VGILVCWVTQLGAAVLARGVKNGRTIGGTSRALLPGTQRGGLIKSVIINCEREKEGEGLNYTNPAKEESQKFQTLPVTAEKNR